jgi:Protein of unknown function (DUF2505)
MRIARVSEYTATVHEVFAVTADPTFQDAKVAATRPISFSATVAESGEQTLIMTERVLTSDGLPDFVKTIVGPTFTIVEHQEWGPAGVDGSRLANVDIHVKGAPVTLRGTISLTPVAEGTLEDLVTELKARIPLLGSKIERAAAVPIERALDIEVATRRDFLGA